MVNTLVTVCGKFVPVFWQLHCGWNNVLTSFPSCQETDEYCWMLFSGCIKDGPMFPNWILQQVPSLVCHVWLGIIMVENHTVAKQRRTVSPDGLLQVFSMAQYLSTLTLHIHSSKSDSNTHDKSQKTVASTLPADGATCSKVTHVCFNKFFDTCNSNFYHHPLWLLLSSSTLVTVHRIVPANGEY